MYVCMYRSQAEAYARTYYALTRYSNGSFAAKPIIDRSTIGPVVAPRLGIRDSLVSFTQGTFARSNG